LVNQIAVASLMENMITFGTLQEWTWRLLQSYGL